MNPGDIVPLALQPGVVALSFLIAFFGSYVALVAAARIRASAQDGVNVRGFVLIAAVSMGGIGIWGMHFIGMQAQRMPFEVGYALWLTLLSAAVAVAFSGMAFWYVGRQAFSLGRCVVAGVLAGLGVAAMHYIGIGAMRMPAMFLWNVELVALSVAVAMASAIAALWLAFNVQREWQRVAAAAVMGLAVCGMHYTGPRPAWWSVRRRRHSPTCRWAAWPCPMWRSPARWRSCWPCAGNCIAATAATRTARPAASMPCCARRQPDGPCAAIRADEGIPPPRRRDASVASRLDAVDE